MLHMSKISSSFSLILVTFSLTVTGTLAAPAEKSKDDPTTHVVSDATKRKGEQQHQQELAEVKGAKKKENLAHDEHRRKGEQQHLRELHESKKATQLKKPKKDN